MVIASKNLLKDVRKLAMKDELFTMRPRGRRVLQLVVKPANKPDSKD